MPWTSCVRRSRRADASICRPLVRPTYDLGAAEELFYIIPTIESSPPLTYLIGSRRSCSAVLAPAIPTGAAHLVMANSWDR